MAKNRSEAMRDAFLARSIRLARVSSWMSKQAEAALLNLRAAIIAELFGSNRPVLLVSTVIRREMNQMRERLVGYFRQVLGAEQQFTSNTIAKYAEVVVPSRSSLLLPDVMGQPFKVWFDKFTDELETRTVGQVRMETATGRRIVVRPDFLLDFFGRTVTGLDALIRTYMNRVQNLTIREIALGSIPDFRWVQISILDSRTTVICRSYAQLEWTKEFEPVGHHEPFKDGAPRHWNCRSLIVPALMEDQLREIGFEDWFQELEGFQRDGIFGKTQSKLYRRRLIGTGDLLRQTTRPLEVAKLTLNL